MENGWCSHGAAQQQDFTVMRGGARTKTAAPAHCGARRDFKERG